MQRNDLVSEELKQCRGSEAPFSPLVRWIQENREHLHMTCIVMETQGRYDFLKSALSGHGIPFTLVNRFADAIQQRSHEIAICRGSLSSGFVWPGERMAIITEKEIFGTRGKSQRQAAPKPRGLDLLSYEDLKSGELVVHVDYGIGRYEGLEKLSIEGHTDDYLNISYRDGDRLFLPVYRMNVVHKYMGVEGVAPALDKMGGAAWEKVKAKVRQSVERIAGDLLNLYATRKVNPGTAFDIEAKALQQFEAGFQFEETLDQRRAIEDVMSDMARDAPMDRLICGDVGYGKTEVALRAAFVTVWNHKQVAVLVPTTVLAEQHHETFAERFKTLPVEIACLTRFRSPKEQRDILRRLAENKEKLKSFRKTVDVLTMTATPIPRTLHMSLSGVRDISVISTPPERRRPVITYISEFDEKLIADAVRKELQRGGQIFFVHNAVQSIQNMADLIQKRVPEVRLAIGHGQMAEAELEKVMFRFVHHDIDLLVCTTIIESGLDIPAANTMIVNRADMFGLAQMYQLRGRIGRGDAQAYAYLFIPGESILSAQAQKRLKVLMEYDDLGAGFQIALNDLRIRGGGTILGASQSGHIASVGYDMFLKLMEEAVSEIKGEPVIADLEPEINIPLSAFIPESYMPDIDQRLTLYRRLSRLNNLKQLTDFKAEMTDRFGPMPKEAANLLLKVMIKILAIQAGVKRLDLSEPYLMIHFSEAHQKNPFGIMGMITREKDRFSFSPDHVMKVRLDMVKESPLSQAKNILKEITQRANA